MISLDELAETLARTIFGADGSECDVYKPGDPGFRVKRRQLTRSFVTSALRARLEESEIEPPAETEESRWRDAVALEVVKLTISADGYLDDEWPVAIASDAYLLADAMLDARKR